LSTFHFDYFNSWDNWRNTIYSYELLPLSDVITALGLAILFFGVFTWLYGKFKGFQVIDFWIYRYSRHPQYLGYVIWSYGLLINTLLRPYHDGRRIPPPSLPWLISTLIIIGVALHEENKMLRTYGEKYAKYREKTPFIIPIPRKLAALINTPTRIIFKKERPENGKEIAVILLFYAIIIILLSFCFPFLYE
jgi:protein-S-isoprenylcysteine O-methyltransferase Ste14